jgi:Cu(I)/Ag(I) efflux system membrane fusion protein
MTDMKKPGRSVPIVAGSVAAALAIGVGIGFWLAPHPMGTAAEQPNRKALYWYDPMVPDQHFDKPGKSPFMDMQLVPRYAGEPDPKPGVRIDPGVTQSLGVRFAIVEKLAIKDTVTASGIVAFNERDAAVIQAKQGGFVDRSYKRAVGDIVQAGAPLVDLRVPEWTRGLAEYLALRKGNDSGLAAAARQRLGMLGVPSRAVSDAETSGTAPAVFVVQSPISGAITKLDVREGMTIEPGAMVATINGLSPIWLTVSVPQGKAAQLKVGANAIAKLAALPGETFTGRVETILPTASAESRTLEVRVVLNNPGNRLRPGMSGEVELSNPAQRQALVVPSESVIRTGQRTVAIVVTDDGRYLPTEVELASTTGDRTEITSGLTEGQRVVASGQFLIDSEANLSGVMARLHSGSAAPVADYTATGRVTAVSDAGVTIAHTPVPELNWPAMTMQFAWGAGGKKNIAVGDEVSFAFKKGGAGYVLERIDHAGGDK